MHVPLGRQQVLMARELLNGSRGRAAHREMRAASGGDAAYLSSIGASRVIDC